MSELDYPFHIRRLGDDEGGGYLIESPICPAASPTARALKRRSPAVPDALASWIATAKEFGGPVPPPSRPEHEVYSGRWNLRVPKSLHRRLAERAKAEGVSLNTLTVSLLAEGLGRRGRDDRRAA